MASEPSQDDTGRPDQLHFNLCLHSILNLSAAVEKAYAPRSTELDLLILADMGVRRVLENEASEASCDLLSCDLLSPAGAPDPTWSRTARGVCATLPDMLPGMITGATGKSSACIQAPF